MSFPLVSLGDFVKIARNGISPEKIQSGTNYVGLENIDGSGNFVDVKGVDAGELASSKFLFTQKQVLFGKLRPYLKKVARPDFDGICSTDILPLLPSKEIDRDYLFHTLRRQSFVDDVSSLSSGANLPRISPKVLSEMQIPLPPLEEQRRIAAILDKADVLRAQRRAAIAKLDELLQSVFIKMFGDPVTNPMGWPETTSLGEVAEIISGITKGRKTTATTRQVAYMAVSNVQDRFLKLDVVKRIEATDDEIEKYRLQRGDLLLTEGGDPDKLGRGVLWRNEIAECIHQNHVFRVRLTSDQLHPLYLNWYVGSERGKRYFLRQAKQTTGIASINMRQLRDLPLLMPPLDLQQHFARIAEKIEFQKQIMQRAAEKAETLFASLQQRAFSGKL